MTRTRYTPEEKESALRLCDEIGVHKASQETGISVNSLYKWRSGVKDEIFAPKIPAPAEVVEVPAATTVPETEGLSVAHKEFPSIPAYANAEKGSNEELIRLQMENVTLKTQITTLKNALRVFTE